MNKYLQNLRKNKYYQKHKNFGKYVFVGAVTSVLNIFLMWLLIDKMDLSTVIGSSIAVVIIFFFKFYSYVLIKMMKSKFITYTLITVAFGIINVAAMWLMVDKLHFTVIVSSTAIVIALFLIRFIAFDKLGLLVKQEKVF